MQPLVSVIIPSHGGAETLQRAVDSVLNQTYENIEVVVVDDNGIDSENHLKTESIMSQYKQISNVKYIVHQKNINGAAARNTGVKNSRGQYIALLDDDDVFFPEKIEIQLNELMKLDSSYALTYCSKEVCKNGKRVSVNHVSYEGYVLYELLMHKFAIGSSSFLIRRCVWDELDGFDESFKRHQDWEFTARVAAKYKIKAVDYVGFRYYLLFRNSPPNANLCKEYRMHYLEKIEPLFVNLRKKQIKDVVVNNRLDVSLAFFKEKKYMSFFKELYEIKPGYRLFVFLWKRIRLIIKRKFFRLHPV